MATTSMARRADLDIEERPRRINEAVAAEVRAAMGRHRTNQTQLARSLGMAQASVSRRLNGETPFDVVELTCIAELLGTSVMELVARAESVCFSLLTTDGPVQQTFSFERHLQSA